MDGVRVPSGCARPRNNLVVYLEFFDVWAEPSQREARFERVTISGLRSLRFSRNPAFSHSGSVKI